MGLLHAIDSVVVSVIFPLVLGVGCVLRLINVISGVYGACFLALGLYHPNLGANRRKWFFYALSISALVVSALGLIAQGIFFLLSGLSQTKSRLPDGFAQAMEVIGFVPLPELIHPKENHFSGVRYLAADLFVLLAALYCVVRIALQSKFPFFRKMTDETGKEIVVKGAKALSLVMCFVVVVLIGLISVSAPTLFNLVYLLVFLGAILATLKWPLMRIIEQIWNWLLGYCALHLAFLYLFQIIIYANESQRNEGLHQLAKRGRFFGAIFFKDVKWNSDWPELSGYVTVTLLLYLLVLWRESRDARAHLRKRQESLKKDY